MKNFLKKCVYVFKYPVIYLLAWIILLCAAYLLILSHKPLFEERVSLVIGASVFLLCGPLIIVLSLMRREGPLKQAFLLNPVSLKMLAGALFLGIDLYFFSRQVLTLPWSDASSVFSLPFGSGKAVFHAQTLDWYWTYTVVTGCITILIKEVVFRGIILRRMMDISSASVAVCVTMLPLMLYTLIEFLVFPQMEDVSVWESLVYPLAVLLFQQVALCLVYLWSASLCMPIVTALAFYLTSSIVQLSCGMTKLSLEQYILVCLLDCAVAAGVLMWLYRGRKPFPVRELCFGGRDEQEGAAE